MTNEQVVGAFTINGNKGFKICFANGWTVSVQFGYGNYCQNYDMLVMTVRDTTTSHDAEIAVWDADHNWVSFDGDDNVKGWVTPNEVAVVIQSVSAIPANQSANDFVFKQGLKLVAKEK